MGLTQSVSASEVAQRTQVSIEEAEELLAAFTKHGGTGTHIGLDTFKQVLRDTQHLYDSPAFSPEAADLYFQIFDTTHDGLSTWSFLKAKRLIPAVLNHQNSSIQSQSASTQSIPTSS